MAKLHSELRIKAVNNITGGSEGDPVQYSSGDIVYDLTSGKFKKHDGAAWQDAVTGVSADLSSTSVGELQDIDLSGISNGDILTWDGSLGTFVASTPSSGSTDVISEGTAKVEVIGSGVDSAGERIEFGVNGSPIWQITTAGHILPTTNSAYDIGSAEKKVRDFYLSNNSLWIGDEHKISIDSGVMKFKRRRHENLDVPPTWQSVWEAYTDADSFTWDEGAIVGLIDGNSGSGAASIYQDLGGAPANLSGMTLAHWERAIEWMRKVSKGTIGSDANINGGNSWTTSFIDVDGDLQMDDPYPNGLQSLFSQDSDFVTNFRFFQDIFEFPNVNLNGVTLSDSAGEGKTLVWNQAVGDAGAFVPADPYKASFASTRIAFDGNANVIALHSEIQDKDGGRVVIDTANFDNINDAIQLDLSQMYSYALKKTMNFEIYSKGTQPFSVDVINPAAGPSTGQQVLNSDIQADLVLNEDANASIDIGEGQMLIIYCDGTSWWHEIRSGL